MAPGSQKVELLIEAKLRDALSSEARRVGTVVEQTGKRGDRAMKSIETASIRTASAIGGRLVKGLAAAGAAFASLRTLSRATQDAVAFERALSEVSTIADPAAFSIRSLRDEVIALSDDLGIDRVESAQSAYQALSTGLVKTQDDFAALRVANELAVAGLADSDATVRVLASALNAYGAAASEATDFSDALFKTVEIGVTTLPELAGSIGRVTTIAAQLGVPFADLNAVLASLTRVGLSTEESVTGLRAVLVSLLRPSEQARKVFEKYGIEVGASAVKSRGLINVLSDLRQRVGDNTDDFGLLFENVRALGPILALTSEDSDALEESLAKMADRAGATAEAFRKIQSSAGAATQRALNRMTNRLVEATGAAAAAFEAFTFGTEIEQQTSKAEEKIRDLQEQLTRMTVTLQDTGSISVLDGLDQKADAATLNLEELRKEGERLQAQFEALRQAGRQGILLDDLVIALPDGISSEFASSLDRLFRDAIAKVDRGPGGLDAEAILGDVVADIERQRSTIITAVSDVLTGVREELSRSDFSGLDTSGLLGSLQLIEQEAGGFGSGVADQLELARAALEFAAQDSLSGLDRVYAEGFAEALQRVGDQAEAFGTGVGERLGVSLAASLSGPGIGEELQALIARSLDSTGTLEPLTRSEAERVANAFEEAARGAIQLIDIDSVKVPIEIVPGAGGTGAPDQAVRAIERLEGGALRFREAMLSAADAESVLAGNSDVLARVERDLGGTLAFTVDQLGSLVGESDALEAARSRLAIAEAKLRDEQDLLASGIAPLVRGEEARTQAIEQRFAAEQKAAAEALLSDAISREGFKEIIDLAETRRDVELALIDVLREKGEAEREAAEKARNAEGERQLVRDLNDALQRSRVTALEQAEIELEDRVEASTKELLLQGEAVDVVAEKARRLRAELLGAAGAFKKGFVGEIDRFSDEAANNFALGADLAAASIDGFRASFSDAAFDLLSGTKDLDDALNSFFANFSQSILRALVELAAFKAAAAIFGSIFGGPAAAASGGSGVLKLPFFPPILAANGAERIAGGLGDPQPLQAFGYANGGPIVRAPHVAIVGEGQFDEAVVPLPNGREIPVDVRGAGGGGQPIEMNITLGGLTVNALDPRGAAEVILEPETRRAIEDAVADSIGSGANRNLLEAVRGA